MHSRVDHALRYVFGGVVLTLTNKNCDSNGVVTEDSPGCWGPTEAVNATVWLLNTVPRSKDPPFKWEKKVCRPALNQMCPPVLSEHTMVHYKGNTAAVITLTCSLSVATTDATALLLAVALYDACTAA